MKKTVNRVFIAVGALAVAIALAAPALGQEVKEKPPMYSYVGNWTIPRAQWADMAKANAADQSLLDKALAGGTIVAYGNDTNLVHTETGNTHDDWWSSMSMAGLMSVLDQFYKAGSSTTPVLESATKHSDEIVVSRYYNWKPGTYKDAYTRVATYKLKHDAPNDAVETLSKNLFVPLLEKMLADGSIVEYEIDQEAIHTDDPNTFAVVFIAAKADALDKFLAAVVELRKSNPLAGPGFGSMSESSAHRDYLSRTNATYK